MVTPPTATLGGAFKGGGGGCNRRSSRKNAAWKYPESTGSLCIKAQQGVPQGEQRRHRSDPQSIGRFGMNTWLYHDMGAGDE